MSGFPQPPAGPYGAPWPHGAPGAYAGGGGVPYGPAPAARRTVQPLNGLATAAMVLLGIVALLSLGRMAAFLVRADAVDSFLNDDFTSIDEIDDADGLVAATTIAYGLGVLSTAPLFIVWQYRHATNAEALGGRMGLGPGWAIGGWFAPFANVVLGAVQLHQTSRATDPGPAPGAASRRARVLIVVWAVLLGSGIALALVGLVTWPDDQEIIADVSRADDAVTSDRIDAVGALAFAGSAVVAAVMVWSLTTAQRERVGALPGGGAGTGYGAAPAPPAWGSPGPPGWGAPPQAPPAPQAPPERPPAWPQPPGYPPPGGGGSSF